MGPRADNGYMTTRRGAAVFLLGFTTVLIASCTPSERAPKDHPTATPSPSPKPVGAAAYVPKAEWADHIVGPLHTAGTRIVDARGLTARLRGVNIPDPRAGGGKQCSEASWRRL